MGNLSLYSIIGYAVFFVIELTVSIRQQRELYTLKDTLSNITMGVGSLVVAGILGKAINFFVYDFFYQFRFFDLPANVWWYWVLLCLGEDFSKYWFHRICHRIRYFWASHVVHHSSQKLNFSTAFRQSWTYEISGAQIFWCWMPLVGFSPINILLMQSINLIYQFWIHTETIGKLPRWFEYVFNTPSHHRVHHSSEPKYINKNFGGVLIIWDRIFGSFRAEDNTGIDKHQYGITDNIKTYNPLRIATHEWASIFRDVIKIRSIKEVKNVLTDFKKDGIMPEQGGKAGIG